MTNNTRQGLKASRRGADGSPVHFRLPIIRLGHACRISQVMGRPLSERAAETIRIGWEDFHARVESTCEEHGYVVNLDGEREAKLDQYQFTPVVRLPRHRVEGHGIRLQCRAYVAVCCEGRLSKLWYRVAQVDPIDLDSEALCTFFRRAEELAGAVTLALNEQYATTLADVLDHVEHPEIEFDLVIRAVESPQDSASDILARLESGEFPDPDAALIDPEICRPLSSFLRALDFNVMARPPFRRLKDGELDANWQVGRGGDLASLVHTVVRKTPREGRTLTGLVYGESTELDGCPSAVVSAELVRQEVESL